MVSPKWPLFIGWLSLILNFFIAFYYFTGLVGWHNIGVEAAEEEGKPKVEDPDAENGDDEENLLPFTRDQIASYTMELVTDVAMFIASIFLIVGVKKQLHKFVAPWVYMFFIMFFVYCVDFFFETNTKNEEFSRFITMFIFILMWYPVYKYYKYLRSPAFKKTSAVQNNVYPYVPPSVYAETTECVKQAPTAPVAV